MKPLFFFPLLFVALYLVKESLPTITRILFPGLSSTVEKIIGVTVLIATTAVICYFYLKKRYFSLIPGIPGVEPRFFWGNILEYGEKMQQDFVKFMMIDSPKISKEIHQIAIFSKKMVVLNDPDLIEEMFKNRDFDRTPGVFKKVIPHAVFSQVGEPWKRHLRVIGPLFQNHKIRHFSEHSFKPITDKLVAKWKKLDSTKPYSIVTDLCKTTLDVIGLAAFGYDFKNFEDSSSDLTEAVSIYLTEINDNGDMSPSLWHKHHPKMEIAKKNIENKIKEMISFSKENRSDLKGTLFSNLLDSDYTQDEIRDEIIVFLFAGNETTSTTMCWGLMMLADNQDVQEKLFQEIDALGVDDPTFEDLKEMNYLHQVYSEIMRLAPTASAVPRTAYKDIKLGKYLIPEGTQLLVNNSYLPRSEYWEKPDCFYPEHFSEEAIKKRRPGLWYAFGGGHRACIGMNMAIFELKYLLYVLIKNFRFKPTGKWSDVKRIIRTTTQPEDSVLYVESRQ